MEQMMNANAEPDQKSGNGRKRTQGNAHEQETDVSLSEKPLSFVLNRREIQTEGKQGQRNSRFNPLYWPIIGQAQR
ncbi:hypothetical protein PO124_00765 [Bacillus licheniformis]|nr:hypothetical protein [Bacillus licheniformis]